jgi:Mrp family chromosome partitioning ATPase
MSDDPLIFQRIAWRIAKRLPPATSGLGVLVTSARPAEGKSYVARALAGAFSMLNVGPVALVECARAAYASPPEHTVTWNEMLVAGAEAKPASTPVTHIPWGGADPSTAFQSAAVARAMSELRSQFKFVVLDGPILADCGELAAITDGSLLVIDASRTRREIIAGGLQANPINPRKMLGAVLNQMPRYVPRWLYRRAL